MAVGGVNYGSSVRVNGYSCDNCSEVDLAARNIDPKHPRSGPFNRDVLLDSTRPDLDPVKVAAAVAKAKAAMTHVVGYSASGAHGAAVAPGALFSVAA